MGGWKVLDARFLRSVHTPRDLPEFGLPEAAFAGRSNVGKSSLQNAVLGRRGLVKTGSRPGVTRSLNFFEVRFRSPQGLDRRAVFVDLPGYGWASAPKRIRAGWAALVDLYLRERADLRLLVLAVDIRRGPEAEEVSLFDWARRAGLPVVVAASKADKVPRGKRREAIRRMEELLGPGADLVLPVSARTGEGVGVLRDRLFELLQD